MKFKPYIWIITLLFTFSLVSSMPYDNLSICDLDEDGLPSLYDPSKKELTGCNEFNFYEKVILGQEKLILDYADSLKELNTSFELNINDSTKFYSEARIGSLEDLNFYIKDKKILYDSLNSPDESSDSSFPELNVSIHSLNRQNFLKELSLEQIDFIESNYFWKDLCFRLEDEKYLPVDLTKESTEKCTQVPPETISSEYDLQCDQDEDGLYFKSTEFNKTFCIYSNLDLEQDCNDKDPAIKSSQTYYLRYELPEENSFCLKEESSENCEIPGDAVNNIDVSLEQCPQEIICVNTNEDSPVKKYPFNEYLSLNKSEYYCTSNITNSNTILQNYYEEEKFYIEYSDLNCYIELAKQPSVEYKTIIPEDLKKCPETLYCYYPDSEQIEEISSLDFEKISTIISSSKGTCKQDQSEAEKGLEDYLASNQDDIKYYNFRKYPNINCSVELTQKERENIDLSTFDYTEINSSKICPKNLFCYSISSITGTETQDSLQITQKLENISFRKDFPKILEIENNSSQECSFDEALALESYKEYLEQLNLTKKQEDDQNLSEEKNQTPKQNNISLEDDDVEFELPEKIPQDIIEKTTEKISSFITNNSHVAESVQTLEKVKKIIDEDKYLESQTEVKIKPEKNKTTFNFKFKTEKKSKNISIVQLIDKKIAKSASEIIYDKNKYRMEVLIDDPLIMWHVLEEPKEEEEIEIEYHVEKEVKNITAQDIESVVTEDLEEIDAEQQNEEIKSLVIAISFIPIIIFLLTFFSKFKKKKAYYNKVYETNSNYNYNYSNNTSYNNPPNNTNYNRVRNLTPEQYRYYQKILEIKKRTNLSTEEIYRALQRKRNN